MVRGDVTAVTTGECTDLYHVDTGMYDVDAYGSVYLLDDADPALVDTGIGTHYDRVLDLLEYADVEPAEVSYVVPTHVHLDHAGGAGFLAAACENATVAVHPTGARHLVDPSRLWEGTKSAVGDQFEFYTEPEPVPHQHVLHDPANDAVFTADAAGIYVPAIDAVRETTPPPQFDLEGALADVETIARLDPSTLLYAHFGAQPTGDRLERYEARLTDWVAAVEAARQELPDDDAVVEHFVESSDMDAVWGERKAAAETAMNVRGVLTYLDRQRGD